MRQCRRADRRASRLPLSSHLVAGLLLLLAGCGLMEPDTATVTHLSLDLSIDTLYLSPGDTARVRARVRNDSDRIVELVSETGCLGRLRIFRGDTEARFRMDPEACWPLAPTMFLVPGDSITRSWLLEAKMLWGTPASAGTYTLLLDFEATSQHGTELGSISNSLVVR